MRTPVCYYNLIAAASESLRDPWIGIHYLETAQPADIGAVGFAAISSETLGEAFARVARYLAYLTEYERISITERDDATHIEWKILGSRHPAHSIVSEMYAYDFTCLAARMSGVPIRTKAVCFSHAPRRPLGDYLRCLAVTRSSKPPAMDAFSTAASCASRCRTRTRRLPPSSTSFSADASATRWR